MVHSPSTVMILLVTMTFCYILSDRNMANGQAYHFSKGWMPGKRSGILLAKHFGTVEDFDNSSEDKLGVRKLVSRKSLEARDHEEEQRINVIEKMIGESARDKPKESDDEMSRLRTLLQTLPRVEGLWTPELSDLHQQPSSLHKRTPSQCEIRPHLTSLIRTLLDKEMRRIEDSCPTKARNLQRLGEFKRLIWDLQVDSLRGEN